MPARTYPDLFITQGLAFTSQDRFVQAQAAYREGVRLATELGDVTLAGRALLNLSDVMLSAGDFATAEETGREGAQVLRRGGGAWFTWAIGNQLQALLVLGRWDEAFHIIRETLQDPVGGSDPDFVWIAATGFWMRGDLESAASLLPVTRELSSSQDPQDLLNLHGHEAGVALASGDATSALAHARLALEQSETFGFASEGSRWIWSIAAGAALALGDLEEVRRLLALIEERQAGKVSLVARADARRVRARLLAAEGDPSAAAAFDESTRALRELGSPWHLAVGLADHADYCAATGDTVIARTLADEARSIATQLGAKPLLERLEVSVVSH